MYEIQTATQCYFIVEPCAPLPTPINYMGKDLTDYGDD